MGRHRIGPTSAGQTWIGQRADGKGAEKGRRRIWGGCGMEEDEERKGTDEGERQEAGRPRKNRKWKLSQIIHFKINTAPTLYSSHSGGKCELQQLRASTSDPKQCFCTIVISKNSVCVLGVCVRRYKYAGNVQNVQKVCTKTPFSGWYFLDVILFLIWDQTLGVGCCSCGPAPPRLRGVI